MPIGPSTHAIGTHAIYSPLQQYLNCVVVSILAFHVQFPHGATICHISFFFPSHPPGVTKPSSSFRCSEGSLPIIAGPYILPVRALKCLATEIIKEIIKNL